MKIIRTSEGVILSHGVDTKSEKSRAGALRADSNDQFVRLSLNLSRRLHHLGVAQYAGNVGSCDGNWCDGILCDGILCDGICDGIVCDADCDAVCDAICDTVCDTVCDQVCDQICDAIKAA
ncbi:MAG: hypothetical protein HY696_04290 [Deltaproteobacteria bacterium]|nr:hypothetical protein [Deltaproteobacteria bacterium]